LSEPLKVRHGADTWDRLHAHEPVVVVVAGVELLTSDESLQALALDSARARASPQLTMRVTSLENTSEPLALVATTRT
jgi:hypothetical protein